MNLWLLVGKEWHKRIVREFGIDMYTLLFLKWITNKDLLYRTGNSVQCYVAAWMGGEFVRRVDICVCMAESLCGPPETIITLFIGCISVYSKKLEKEE